MTEHPKEYFQYKLKGIIIHQGSSESGHYYSLIQDRKMHKKEHWYEFNDCIVDDFDQ